MQNEFNQMDLSKREQKVHVLNKGFLWKDLWYAMSRPGKNICPLNLCAKHRDDSSSVRYKLILNEDGLPCEREFRSTLLHVLLSFLGYKNHPFFAPPLPPQTWWPRIPSYLRTIWLVDPSGPWCRSLRCNVRLGSFGWINPYAICFFADPVSDIFQTYYISMFDLQGRQPTTGKLSEHIRSILDVKLLMSEMWLCSVVRSSFSTCYFWFPMK